ncbi:MAG: molybdenum cofactor guanylyltransferase [Acidobacteriota bacterium]
MLPRPVGVVLAGGASSRMGRDKALLEIEGETLLARAARRLGEVCEEVLVADAGRLGGIPDGPGRGPAAGVLGAARARPGRALLALAVDLPFVTVPLLEELAGSEADLAIPGWSGGPEPLCALYGPAALAVLEERVSRGELSLWSLPEAPGLRVRRLEEAELRRFGDPARLFLNLNRPEDLP